MENFVKHEYYGPHTIYLSLPCVALNKTSSTDTHSISHNHKQTLYLSQPHTHFISHNHTHFISHNHKQTIYLSLPHTHIQMSNTNNTRTETHTLTYKHLTHILTYLAAMLVSLSFTAERQRDEVFVEMFNRSKLSCFVA